MKQINLQKIQNKLRNKFIKSGVKMTGPETIFFSEDTKIGKNVIIDPYVVIGRKVKIGNNVRIHSSSLLSYNFHFLITIYISIRITGITNNNNFSFNLN